MRVIVTGSDGFVGKRLCERLRKMAHEVIECDLAEDVLTWQAPEADAVIHLAANKYATDGEQDPYGACRFNIDATAAAIKMAPKVILASTCKAADPITCYGASKLICERMVLNAGGTVVRLVNVIGSSGSVTDIWADVPENEPLPVTDCWRMFIHPDAAADMFVKALELPSGRFAPVTRLTEGMWMTKLAARLYPDRPIKMVPLRFGDRPEERLFGEYEYRERHNMTFDRIFDTWEYESLELAA